jgi:hypothetical protein
MKAVSKHLIDVEHLDEADSFAEPKATRSQNAFLVPVKVQLKFVLF